MEPRGVIITGAGAGIGQAVARRFAEAGDTVYLADLSEKRLTAAVAETAGSVHGRVLDVTDFAAVEALVDDVVREAGSLDVFVNNAGVFDGYAGIAETGPALWNTIIGVNLTGYFHGAKAASRPMIAQGSGRIVNIGSVAGQRGAADGLAYAAAKAGIEGMTRRLAFDLGPHGVTANVVAPGVIATNIRANSSEVLGDLVDTDRGVGVSPELMDFLIPARRSGTPAEVAAAVAYLAGPEAAYVNGQVIHVDGGWTAT